MVAADKQAMYQAVDTNGFTRESCCFCHHSAHHSNQQRVKNKKRDRRIHLDACFILLPFWDFGITFQSDSWCGLAWLGFGLYSNRVFRCSLCEFSWCVYVTNFDCDMKHQFLHLYECGTEFGSSRVKRTNFATCFLALTDIWHNYGTFLMFACHLRVSSNKNDFDNGFFFGLISEKLSSSQLRKH